MGQKHSKTKGRHDYAPRVSAEVELGKKLWYAIIDEDFDQLEKLLMLGADPNYVMRDISGPECFLFTCFRLFWHVQVRMFRRLVDAGARMSLPAENSKKMCCKLVFKLSIAQKPAPFLGPGPPGKDGYDFFLRMCKEASEFKIENIIFAARIFLECPEIVSELTNFTSRDWNKCFLTSVPLHHHFHLLHIFTHSIPGFILYRLTKKYGFVNTSENSFAHKHLIQLSLETKRCDEVKVVFSEIFFVESTFIVDQIMF